MIRRYEEVAHVLVRLDRAVRWQSLWRIEVSDTGCVLFYLGGPVCSSALGIVINVSIPGTSLNTAIPIDTCIVNINESNGRLE
jgi:hypothetical protein